MKQSKKMAVLGMAAVHFIGIFAVSNVLAEESAGWKNYGQLKFGMLQPVGDMDDANYDTGAGFSATYGRYLTDFLVIEGTAEIAGNEGDVDGYDSYAGNYSQDNTLTSSACLLTLKGVVGAGPVQMYGGGGVGVYSVTLDSEIETNRLGEFDKDESDSVFGAHAVAGATFNATDRLFFGVEGLYRWTDEVDIHETVANIPVEYKGDLSGFLVTLTAGFRF